jgi:two-component system chemotaxis sensor kinase CheA
MSALIVEAGGQRFAIPQLAVRELVRAGAASEHRIERVNVTRLLRLRDKLLPLLGLAELLQIEEPSGAGAAVTVVVMQVGARLFGVAVDAVFHTEEIVVKPLASLLRDVAMFSGNTILGDGSVIMIVDPNALAVLVGAVEAGEERINPEPAVMETTAAGTISLLLFKAGSPVPKAVPLSLITRLEEIEIAAIEQCNGEDVVQYRGALMPLVYVGEAAARRDGQVQKVIVLGESGHPVGLAVDEIVDIVEDRLTIEIGAGRPGIAGSAIVGGRAAEVVDVSHYLARDVGKRLIGKEDSARPSAMVLLADASQFFRDMLAPLLSGSGYAVTSAESAGEALRIMDRGEAFDAVVCDLDLPDMDGVALAERIKRDWAEVSMIALSADTQARLDDRARGAGFIAVVGKFDRQRLLDTLRACCKPWGRAA